MQQAFLASAAIDSDNEDCSSGNSNSNSNSNSKGKSKSKSHSNSNNSRSSNKKGSGMDGIYIIASVCLTTKLHTSQECFLLLTMPCLSPASATARVQITRNE